MLALTRRSESRPAPARGEAMLPPSVLGPGVTIQGTLEVEGELVISGTVAGHIAALRLVIASDGCVEGDVVAREVVIAGRLIGRVFAPTVSVEASADIEGRIFHTDATVAQGARIVGRMPWRPVSYFETLDQLPEIRP
ncbi:MAG TPA: polymer-forming cytoskeletal protein [Rhizomicrobium sp.]|nr:polymer-forming cytoskeletal protein [Rhizomicrobium sp.]